MIDDLDTMDESLETTLTKDEVEKCVEDWKKRIHALFDEISAWAKADGWQVTAAGTVRMHEEFMQRFDVPAIEQPTLRLDRQSSYALFRPKGLWVIGANGRIDLYTGKGIFVILDRAESLAAPCWTIFRASPKLGGDLFKPEMIAKLV